MGESIAALVAVSLVAADVSGETVTYRLLESARAYGRARLVDLAELEQVSRRHAEYFLTYFQSASVRSSGWSSLQWVEAYKSQLDNLRAALDWASSSREWRLRDALTTVAVPLLTHLSLNEECRSRVQSALSDRPAGLAPDAQFEVQLLAGLGMSLLYTSGGGPKAYEAWRDCLSAAEKNCDIDYQLRAIGSMWSVSFREGKMREVRRLHERFEALAGLSPSVEDALHAKRMHAIEMFYYGQFKEACKYQREVYEAYLKGGYSMDVLRFRIDQTVLACVNLSKTLWVLGFPDHAKTIASRSVEIAQNVHHDISTAYALAYSACRISVITGDFLAAETYIENLLEISVVDQNGPWKYFGLCWKGALLSRQGDATGAATILSEALVGVPEGSFGMHHTRFLGELAYADAGAGNVAAGLAHIGKAIELCERLDEQWFLAELIRLEGEIILIGGGPGANIAARDRFTRSLALAKRQGALSFELRAATSLARLGFDDGNGTSVQVLGEIYGRFTEGFGTSDLIRARTILESSA
ncbi:hypothetical protein [Aureimonas sp. SA4125]|uniref:hypothetical protein n=1 Tax=Aureimonas sp. SA4125 TaxID=2826993 RepID=UPI001CC43CDD|nr:hypothetical protein [Aureimonas sp. SA4125]